MEGAVNGIRRTFFHDLTEDYLEHQTSSFLYRAFWSENMKGLLKAHFPELLGEEPPAPEDAGRLRALLVKAMRERPEWADDLPLRRQSWKLRRDFWEELWLNDIGYRAKLITDTEYYLWLARYLAVHDVYYKTNIYYYKGTHRDRMARSGHTWLYKLLRKGLGTEDLGALKREVAARKKARRKTRRPPGDEEDLSGARAGAALSKAEVEEALAMLSERIQSDGDAVAGRLHDLKDVVRTRDGTAKERDYLPRLTARLEWMALHVKIKNWLQDSGYPLVGHSGAEEPPEEEKKVRRSDFTLRLFEAYCDSAEGYELHKKAGGGGADGETGPGNWHSDGLGFCMLDTDPDQLESLLEVLEAEQDEAPYLYLPLAVHLHSGCVFFLAGKANYEEVYQKAGGPLEAVYRRMKARYCFDYLRLVGDRSGRLPGDGTFRLSPAFHLRPAVPGKAGESYQKALKAFKRYCGFPDGDSPLQAVREYNRVDPADIPEPFLWAFEL